MAQDAAARTTKLGARGGFSYWKRLHESCDDVAGQEFVGWRIRCFDRV